MVTVGESVSHGLVLDVDNEALLWASAEEKGCVPAPDHVSFLCREENKDAAGNCGVLRKRAISPRGAGSGKSAEEYYWDTFFNFQFFVAMGAKKKKLKCRECGVGRAGRN